MGHGHKPSGGRESRMELRGERTKGPDLSPTRLGLQYSRPWRAPSVLRIISLLCSGWGSGPAYTGRPRTPCASSNLSAPPSFCFPFPVLCLSPGQIPEPRAKHCSGQRKMQLQGGYGVGDPSEPEDGLREYLRASSRGLVAPI